MGLFPRGQARFVNIGMDTLTILCFSLGEINQNLIKAHIQPVLRLTLRINLYKHMVSKNECVYPYLTPKNCVFTISNLVSIQYFPWQYARNRVRFTTFQSLVTSKNDGTGSPRHLISTNTSILHDLEKVDR